VPEEQSSWGDKEATGAWQRAVAIKLTRRTAMARGVMQCLLRTNQWVARVRGVRKFFN